MPPPNLRIVQSPVKQPKSNPALDLLDSDYPSPLGTEAPDVFAGTGHIGSLGFGIHPLVSFHDRPRMPSVFGSTTMFGPHGHVTVQNVVLPSHRDELKAQIASLSKAIDVLSARVASLEQNSRSEGEAPWIPPLPIIDPGLTFEAALAALGKPEGDDWVNLLDYIAEENPTLFSFSGQLAKTGLGSSDPAVRSAAARAVAVTARDAASVLDRALKDEKNKMTRAVIESVQGKAPA